MSPTESIQMRPSKSLNQPRIPSFSSDEFEENNPLKQSTSSRLVKVYGTKIEHLNGCNVSEESSDFDAKTAAIKPACHTLMELARSRLFHMNSWKDDIFCNIATRFGDQLNKSDEPFEDLELAMLLLASADKVAEKDFDSARKLLCLCDNSVLIQGTPVQRIVFYFAEALKLKINSSFGGTSSSRILDWVKMIPMDVRQTLASLEPAMMESHHESCSLVTEFTGIQCILDSIATSNTIHLIDFGIKNGSHWIVLMQALAVGYQSPIEHLKITAVGTSKQMLEETGKWLSSFASTLDLCFSFNIVLAELMDVKEDMFKLEDDETLAVYLPMRIASLLVWPNKLERLIDMIKKLNPCIIMVQEIEATINSPNFIERFNEALLFFGVVFDYMSVCFEYRSLCRKLNEEVYLRQMIQNMISQEGTDIIHRHERIGFWRDLFARFDLVEAVLSPSALSQANMLLKMTTFGKFYTPEMDGECLLMGWKGFPIQSVSAWKFCNTK